MERDILMSPLSAKKKKTTTKTIIKNIYVKIYIYVIDQLNLNITLKTIKYFRLLIKYGCDLNEKTESGDTPLHLACYRGFPEIVQILIEAGANFNMFNSKHQIPSDIAYVQGYYTIVNYLQAVKQIGRLHNFVIL